MVDRLLKHNSQGYAVFLFPQALEALGEAIKPYLQDGKGGPHVLCQEIDTAGALIEMTLDGHTVSGEPVELELMVPSSMVRMIVSARSDEAFGFGPRPVTQLPAVGPGETGAEPPTDAAAGPEATSTKEAAASEAGEGAGKA
ncbi:hypothetical protein [Lysobacter sp. D1-1-M9]|uniref:hypothetical protein n=1 Tax=Novilysobacter longmucuonensis TaxID=3098603 RepID=UPI002FC85474